MNNAHFRIRCSCGSIMHECRCSAAQKQETVIPNGCERCKADAELRYHEFVARGKAHE